MNFKILFIIFLFVSCTENSRDDIKRRFLKDNENQIHHIQLYNNNQTVDEWCSYGKPTIRDGVITFVDNKTKMNITVVGTCSIVQTNMCILKPRTNIKNFFQKKLDN